MKYISKVREHFDKQMVFTLRDLRIFLKKEAISVGYADLLLHNMVSKGEITRITKGVYTFNKDLEVVGFAFPPFYYGLQDALSLRNIWEQETNPIVITPKKVRTGIRQIMDSNVLVRKISRKMFFGFELIKCNNYWLPVSDAEKTLIDFVYFNESLPKDTLEELTKKVQGKKLETYLKKTPKRTRAKVERLLKLK